MDVYSRKYPACNSRCA